MASAAMGAVAALLEIATATLPDDAMVYFGKELPKYTAPLTFAVCGFEGNQEPAELGPNYRREETASLLCDLTSYAGDQDWLSRMSEVMTAFALLTVAVGNNWTLNNTVRFAEPGDFLFTPEVQGNGQSIGSLTFAIRYSQRVDSLD